MKKSIRYLTFLNILFSLVLVSFPAFALKSDQEFIFISTDDLAKGIKEKSVFVFDANVPSVYQKNHIPTAMHVNYNSPDLKLLPQNKNASLVFYCKNPHCLASHEAAGVAKSNGYTNVRVYPLGIDGWIAAGMLAETVK